jgi:Chaperone of endosialidase
LILTREESGLQSCIAAGQAGESNTIRIGNSRIAATFIRGISGATAGDGAAVFVNSAGHVCTLTSSAQFKDEIKPMGDASEAIVALRPVSFRYKKDIDSQGIPEFGLWPRK